MSGELHNSMMRKGCPIEEVSSTCHCSESVFFLLDDSTVIDPKRLSREFVGREYNESFLDDLPVGIDSCGENGEFHSFAFDGPMFHKPIGLSLGKVVDRDGFVFADLNRSWS